MPEAAVEIHACRHAAGIPYFKALAGVKREFFYRESACREYVDLHAVAAFLAFALEA